MERTRWAAGVRAAISGIIVVSGLAAIHLVTGTTTAAASATPTQPAVLNVTLRPAYTPAGSTWTTHRVCAAVPAGRRHCDAIELLPTSAPTPTSAAPAVAASAVRPAASTGNPVLDLLCLLLPFLCPA